MSYCPEFSDEVVTKLEVVTTYLHSLDKISTIVLDLPFNEIYCEFFGIIVGLHIGVKLLS